MTLQQQRSDTGLATALRISVSRLARRLRVERLMPELAEPALSDTQLAALATLERHGAMSPGDLAEHEKVQPPSMTRVIAALPIRRPHTRQFTVRIGSRFEEHDRNAQPPQLVELTLGGKDDADDDP